MKEAERAGRRCDRRADGRGSRAGAVRLRCAALAAAVAAACSHVDPDRERAGFEAMARASNPPATHVIGTGDGRTAEEAEEAARAALAAALRAEIERRFEAWSAERARDGDGPSDRRAVERAVSFLVPDLGAALKPVRTRRIGVRFAAVAAATRERLDAVVDAAAARTLAVAMPAWQRIAETPRWVEASAAWCDARAAADAIDALDLARLALSGRYVWGRERLERWSAAAARLAEARRNVVTVVAMGAGFHPPEASAPFVAAIREAGWRAEEGPPSCRGEIGVVVETHVESLCALNSSRLEVCTATLFVEGRACGADSTFSERSGGGIGTHPRDSAEALRLAAAAIPLRPIVDRTRERLLVLLGERCADSAAAPRR